MSNSYDIDGVTVTPTGGGFYELTHPSLPDPVKERGKEKADERARTIAAAFKPDEEGSMPPQGDLTNQAPPPPPPPAPQSPDKEAEKSDPVAVTFDVAAMAQQLADTAKQLAELQALVGASAGVTTVQVTDTPPASDDRVPSSVPRQYTGTLADEQREALHRMGIKTTRVILEENQDIPPTGLFLGHNGRGYMITPGEPVDVPDFLLGVLDDAKMSAPVVDNKTQKVLGYRERMKYPYRRV